MFEDMSKNQMGSPKVKNMGNSETNPLIKLQESLEIHCKTCKKKISDPKQAVNIAAIDGVNTYCEACYYDRIREHLDLEEEKPIFTVETFVVLGVIFSISTSLLFVKQFWFIPPFIYCALVIDLYHMIYEVMDRREAQKYRNHYNHYGTFILNSYERKSTVDMIKEFEAREDVSRLEKRMHDKDYDIEANWFDVMKYNLSGFMNRVLDVLAYFRLTLYCMLYAGAIILILSIFFMISRVLN